MMLTQGVSRPTPVNSNSRNAVNSSSALTTNRLPSWLFASTTKSFHHVDNVRHGGAAIGAPLGPSSKGGFLR